MGAGRVGEGLAMYDLYQSHASGGEGTGVLVATLILLLAVVTGPLLGFTMVLKGLAERVTDPNHRVSPE